MVDAFDNVIRFGDNTFGGIPPKNAVIKCTYQVLPGPEALIKAGELKHILDVIPGLGPITISGNKDARGGMYFVKKGEQLAKGLENFKKPYRLITAADFEHALMNDFNELQLLTRQNIFNELPIMIKDYHIKKLQELKDKNEINILTQFYQLEKIEEKINQLEDQLKKKFTEEEKKELRFQFLVEKYFHKDYLPKSLYKIYRSTALMNREFIKPSQLVEHPGHVTILVIPEFNEAGLKSKNYIEVDKKLEDKILRFLDQRRLLTTHLHIMPTKLKKINIKIYVVIFKERSSEEMEETIRKQVTDFMDLLHGGFHQKGWPPGKNLYKSHLYRLVESIAGVDYVKSLDFSPASEKNCIEIRENELPVIEKLNVSVERT
jgi:hypothetical protein